MTGSWLLSPSSAGGRATWERFVTLLVAFLVLTSMLAYAAARPPAALAVGPATKLAITVNVAPSYTADDPIGLTVEIQNAGGNTVTTGPDSTATVDLALTNPDGATLSGTTSMAAVGGVAAFTSVNVRKVGTDYGLDASSGELAGASSGTFAITPGVLDSFTVDEIVGPKTAGVFFTVSATAYDAWGNVKTDYLGGATLGGTLSTSPGILNGTGIDPDYGVFDPDPWSNGSSSASVTAYAAETGQTVTVSDGTPSGTSNSFDVVHANADSIDFEVAQNDVADPFAFKPITTEVSTPIYSACAPSGGTAPCALTTAGIPSTSVRTLVRDEFGNRVDGEDVEIKNGATLLGSDATDNNGVADFGEQLSIGSVGNFTLTAQVTTGDTHPDTTSPITIVNDLEACDGASCDNNASNGQVRLQKAFGEITTGTDFFGGSTNVLLSTQFVAGSEVSFRCGNNQTIGDAIDMVVAGPGVADTSPSTTMVLVMPKNTLKAYGITARGTETFNVCLGATNISGVSVLPWTAKPAAKKGGLIPSVLTDGRYWGIPANCGTAGLSASDPCIGLRTKQAATAKAYLGMSDAQFAQLGIKDADLVVIIEKQFPWDGKGGLH